MDFVVFSDDWGVHPSSCQHIFRHVAREHRVLWVNTVGMRSPRLTPGDLRKAARKLGRMLRSAAAPSVAAVAATQSVVAGPVVVNPAMLPFPGSKLARLWNARSATRTVRHAMERLKFENPVVVSTVPNACDVVGQLGASAIIYYCVDDFAQWPGLDAKAVRAMEDMLIEQSDLILAASPVLQQRLALRKRTELLPHGVDLTLFSSDPEDEYPALAGLPRPRAGFYGLLDTRLDQELVIDLARRMPDWSFVFAGPQETAMKKLTAQPNIHVLERIPYAELPGFIAGMDVLLLPYRVDEFTHTLAPLKLKEYVLSGKPVISAPLDGVETFGGLVSIPSSAEEWQSMIRNARGASSSRPREQALALLQVDSWESRASTLVHMAELLA